MQLSRIDLNLFTVFAAIYREGGITAASRRLHLSQPAVSHALARLRELLHDPLFERQGNRMIATPKARAMALTIGHSLGALAQMLDHASDFDAASSARTFVVAVREAHELSLMPRLLERMQRDVPHSTLSLVRIERSDVEEDLQSGELDAVIDVALPLSAQIRREHLGGQSLLVLARAEHPVVRGTLDLATYLELEHILVTGRRHGSGFEDIALAQLGVSRSIRVRCQQHAAACRLVSRSDLLVTLPRQQAELANAPVGNQLLPFPAEAPAMDTFLYWHANVDADPASQWLRRTLAELLRQ